MKSLGDQSACHGYNSLEILPAYVKNHVYEVSHQKNLILKIFKDSWPVKT